MTRPTFSWVLPETRKFLHFDCPDTGPIEKRDTRTDTDGHRQTDGRTNKHQILGTLYTKGPKGQIFHDQINDELQ